ncbi:MAG: hypothetical protein TR69_WS6001000688 [candidate division WS6 bacterium OLB20]|uniref:7 transmembrane helices usually fused to an inactive transglutaminase domain-containing protein n=1 Tax=candidate division WS6 bacterium OLB20 TaxID=1617426 RepID=A0A136LYK6_9BACT|nr:MAG: hypothetical protein TR69_WS6001000688 [candidate division WS6 bacterium OLB20]
MQPYNTLMQELFAVSETSLDIILLLLTLPVVATIIAFAKHFLGLRSLSIFIVLILTFVLFEFGSSSDLTTHDIASGFRYGLLLLMITFLLTTASYGIIKSWALHYYPKLALVLTSVSLGYAFILIISDSLGVLSLIRFNVFSLLLAALLAERIMNLLARKPFKTAVFVTVESTVIASLCYLVIGTPAFGGFILAYPWVLLLLFPINYVIGRYTGLRLKEYYRFRDILNEEE